MNKTKFEKNNPPTSRHELERAIFEYYHASQSEDEREELLLQLKGSKKSLSKLEEQLSGHFYLAPQNILRAHVLLAILCYLMTLAIMAVRVGSDFISIVIAIVIGTCAAVPYIANYFLLRNFYNFSRFQFLAKLSFAYTFFISWLFIIISLELDLSGVILIPVIILIFYYVELKKLKHLLKELKLTKPSNG